MSRGTRDWRWKPKSAAATAGARSTGVKAIKSGASFEDEIVAMGTIYWLKRIAKWEKITHHTVKTRKGIISLKNPFLDFLGTTRGGLPLWFEAKSTLAPYLDVSNDPNSRGLKQSQLQIIKDQTELGAHPFILWEYRWKDSHLSKVMFIPAQVILKQAEQVGRLKAEDFPNIRKGADILIVEAFLQHLETIKK